MIEEKDLWKCIPFLILPSLIFFFIGDTRWAVLSLGLIPLFVIGWDTYILYFSEEAKRMREIWKHLTETEQRQLKKLAGI